MVYDDPCMSHRLDVWDRRRLYNRCRNVPLKEVNRFHLPHSRDLKQTNELCIVETNIT